MALVTIQRSPTPTDSPVEEFPAEDAFSNSECQSTDGRETAFGGSQRSTSLRLGSASECYFAVKGAAVILPQTECIMMSRQSNTTGGEIQQHLQAMLHLLRPQDTLKMAVRLESLLGKHTRYMAIVSSQGCQDNQEALILGIDYVSREQTTIGLVLPIWASTAIVLDGDGGISVESAGQHHIFKPVSVQAMWSAFQSLHKENTVARSGPYFPGGLTHTWVQYYACRVTSPEAFRSEWHYTFADESDLKADSMQRFREKPPERAAAEKLIRLTLKDVMQSVDLDEVTSKDIREGLEVHLELNLSEYKEFIDQEMLVILGQMDKPSRIFDYLYLGTEWNASNWDELRMNTVGYILNVTKEVDNFFPGLFNYMKIRVSDEESSELIKHWDQSYKFIKQAKESKCAVLVHCKKGISRSSSTVIAYAMKEYDWTLETALNFVKTRRNCITPNKGFISQLRTYNGMLSASRNRTNQLFNQLPIQRSLAEPEKPWGGLYEEQREMESSEQGIEYTHKVDRPMPLGDNCAPGLLVASENILKSCPAPLSLTPCDPLPECPEEPDQVVVSSVQQQSEVPFDKDSLPLPGCQASTVRRTLQNVENKTKGQQEELTLKDVQQILMKTKRLSGSQGSASSGASSMSSDTSSLESTSGDEAEIIGKERRNSKSSGTDSTADSAVADLAAPSSSPRFERSLQRASNNELYSARPAMVRRPRSLLSLDSSVHACLPSPGQVKRVTQSYEQTSLTQRKSEPDALKPTSKDKPTHKKQRNFFGKLFNRSSHHPHVKANKLKDSSKWYQKDSSPVLKVSQPGKVKDQKERLERLSREKQDGPSSARQLVSGKATVKRITSDLESKAAANNELNASDRLTGNASEDNLVRSLVGVFESSSSCSAIQDSSNNEQQEDTAESVQGPFPPPAVRRRGSFPVTFHLGAEPRRSGSVASLEMCAQSFLPVRGARSLSLINPVQLA